MTRILYFDCYSGISGDMTLGALLDLGVDQQELFRQLSTLGVKGYQLKTARKQLNGIVGTDFDVVLNTKQSHHHRHLPEIKAIIENSKINQTAKDLAKRMFEVIARSEAKIHGKAINDIHFHEVGAIDSIIDIVGAAVCISLLKPDKVVCSPLHLGSGTIKCAHGYLPVPAPATVDILKGIPVYSTYIQGELVTPTGAAIIKTIATEFGPIPGMTILKTGYGTGKKELKIPNLLRVLFGKASDSSAEELVLLETNIDDMNPEIYSYLLPLLMERGALDAYLTNIVMKKGRPGVILSVLCEPGDAESLEEIIFSETSTLGIRHFKPKRSCLDRVQSTIQTDLGPVIVKSAYKDGKHLKSAPEYEVCKKLARNKGIPLKEVYDRIISSHAFKELEKKYQG